MSRVVDAAWTVILVLAGALMGLHRNVEQDIYFHLNLGRAVLRHGSRIVPEPTAFADFDPMCVVPVWLWDVAAYSIYRVGGFSALGVATVLTAALSAFVLARLCRRCTAPADFFAFAWVATLAVICVGSRYEMRPQTLAAVTQTTFVWLVLVYSDSSGRNRIQLGIAIVALCLLWAQTHNSFVLAPVIFALLIGATLWRRSRDERRVDGIVMVGCLASCMSSAHGIDIVAYTLAHAGGDAVRHVSEMHKPTLSDVPDLAAPEGRAVALLWLFCVAGIVRGGKVRSGEILSALFGIALFSRSIRFASEAAILAVPLAAGGASNLLSWARTTFAVRVRTGWAAMSVMLLSLALADAALASSRSPDLRFGIGIEDDSVPKLAARYLARLPPGSRVLTTHGSGPYLGFQSDGRIRTHVDGRTPMYFHDADFAVHREVMADATALELAWQRWSIAATVVERDRGVCDFIAKRWVPVVVEGRFSTFVPPGTDQPLPGVDPCGPAPLRLETCADGGRALDAAIQRLSRLGDAPMISLLRAARQLLCGGSLPEAQRELEAARPMWHRAPWNRLRARAMLQAGNVDEAFELLLTELQAGDVNLVSVLSLPEAQRMSPAQFRQLLDVAVWELDDSAKPGLRSVLARLCMHQGDAECVRAQALRAAARGESSAIEPLVWLARHHPSPRVRADADAWARLLQQRGFGVQDATEAGVP